MKIAPLKSYSDSRPDIRHTILVYGLAYGLIAGLAFAVSLWGADGYLLSQANAFFPWLKLIVGTLLCVLIGGLTGWLTARLEQMVEHAAVAVLPWLGAAAIFAWLTVAVPLQIAPRLAAWLEPDLRPLLQYAEVDALQIRLGVALVWVLIFAALVGVAQLVTLEPAVFSTALLGKILPFCLGIVIISIGGAMLDDLNNQPLRAAVIAMDRTIQFVLDNEGRDVDPALSRRMHAGSLRALEGRLDQSRRLIVGSYDESLGEVHVLISFGDEWADCIVLYAQPAYCKSIP